MVPNQRKVYVEKGICDAANKYTAINLNALFHAMNDLKKGSSFKLWMYFAKNQNGYEFDLSRVDCNEWGIKTDSYHSAFEDLTQKGYLENTKGNRYIFHELI